MEVKITPIPAEIAVAEGLDAIAGDLQKVLDKSENETTVEVVRTLLDAGQAVLFIGRNEDNKYVGFIITGVVEGTFGKWVTISFAYARPEYSKENLLDATITYLDKDIRGFPGFRGLVVQSTRKGMGRYLARRGFKQRFVEYVKEFTPKVKSVLEA